MKKQGFFRKALALFGLMAANGAVDNNPGSRPSVELPAPYFFGGNPNSRQYGMAAGNGKSRKPRTNMRRKAHQAKVARRKAA